MFDFTAARNNMVDGQIRTVDVTAPDILSAMRSVPRERFLPQETQQLAYLDLEVPVATAPERRLLAPMVLARLLQAAAVRDGEHVLDVGCGTGYTAALLSTRAIRLVALEADAALAAQAQANLAAAGIATVSVLTGPLEAGAADQGPFDVILVEGAFAQSPERLFAQLSPNGRLVGIREERGVSAAMLYQRTGSDISARFLFNATAALLPGLAAQPQFHF